ncbi:hypothetical protein OQA88_2257 [Cercophora sp. LCS_1]
MVKEKQSSAKDKAPAANGDAPAASAASPAQLLVPATTTMTNKSGKTKAPPQQHLAPALIICRNKHWKYISSFHGPWLQLPPEILETMANINYYTPRPRPMDPAVFYDMVKIRRLVDDSTNLAVRAASGVASVNTMPNTPQQALALGLGSTLAPGSQTKLSRERKYRMREQATQKLARAYRLDEIACSVATMQSASALEEVASHVLQRNEHDPDAEYVHFFHEKIPSRQLAESTDFKALNEIITARHSDGEPLRTRATVRLFKGDFDGAVADLTEALRVHRLYRPAYTAPKMSLQDPEMGPQSSSRRQEDLRVKDENQPNSLEIQLLFQRAGAHLSIACQHVDRAFPPPTAGDDRSTSSGTSEFGAGAGSSAATEQAQKNVRTHAKRALRDYTAYLSHFEYTPDLPVSIAQDFSLKMGYTMHGIRPIRTHGYSIGPESPAIGDGSSPGGHRIYVLSELFTATPPSDLPPYPSTELIARSEQSISPGPARTTTETLTFHPLLQDALHALLLCHCLIQTSAKELQRHAHMVARLARLADGYPIFQTSRSPARADWVEILRASGNWIQLAQSWDDLCAPAPLPMIHFDEDGDGPAPVSLEEPFPGNKQKKALSSLGSDTISGPDSALVSMPRVRSAGLTTETEEQRKERFRQQAILEALGDDRVGDEESFRQAVRARQLRAERDYHLDNAVHALDNQLGQKAGGGSQKAIEAPRSGTASPEDPTSASEGSADSTVGNGKAPSRANGSTSNGNGATPRPSAHRRWNPDDAYPIMTDRAMAVSRWVNEAPANAGVSSLEGGKRRKKKPVKRRAGAPSTLAAGSKSGAEANCASEDRLP